MTAELKERPRQMLEFIERYLEQHGYPPTVREIGKAVGISSTSHVTYYLDQLEAQEYIVRERSVSRGIRLLVEEEEPEPQGEREMVSIPFLGQIVAGLPLSSETLPGTEKVEVSRALLNRDVSKLFALKVKGDSMIDALVRDGDLVILCKQEEVNNGEMAAVWLDDRDEMTLKYYRHDGDEVTLIPANPTMEPIPVPAEHVHVQGKVVLVIREIK
jgi:repressor LexA